MEVLNIMSHLTLTSKCEASHFDVSQTDGRPLPSIGVNELTGDVRQYEMFFEALKRSCPVPIAFEQIDSGA